jgi:hypothetical protein
MKHAFLAVLGVAALAFPALASSATPAHNVRHASVGALGVVPPHVGGQTIHRSVRPTFPGLKASPFADGSGNPNVLDNLTYGGPDQTPTGQVMTHVTNYAIYWNPGAGYDTAPNYRPIINGFFHNVAKDSGKTTNVWAAATQYGDPVNNNFQYGVSFGGSAVDTQPVPTSDCTMPSDVVGDHSCLSDVSLQAEIKRFADSKGWPHGPNVEFFLFTPHHMGSCFYTTAQAGNNNVCSYDYYCAYHSAFWDNNNAEYVYSNMPWPNNEIIFNNHLYHSDCDGGQHPNGLNSNGTVNALNAADEVIGVTSHESNESITDPTGYEWWNDNAASPYAGYENGDMCAWYFPNAAVLGSTATGQYNQAIGEGKYYMQGEWSNADADLLGWSGCVWSYPGGNLTG